jgi:hypothetical protein
MSGTIPEVVDTNTFDRPHQRCPPTVHMAYSDIVRRSGSPLTQSQTNSQDGESVNTTIARNVSRQDTNDSGMSMITGISLMKKRMEEIDNQRVAFTTKQQRMDKIISTVTSSVSKLSADILPVRIDMNTVSDKLEKKFNESIALLATTQTPTRKVARGEFITCQTCSIKKWACRCIWRRNSTTENSDTTGISSEESQCGNMGKHV